MQENMSDELINILYLEDQIMDLVETLGRYPSEAKQVDPRAWKHLLVYVPKAELEAKLNK